MLKAPVLGPVWPRHLSGGFPPFQLLWLLRCALLNFPLRAPTTRKITTSVTPPPFPSSPFVTLNSSPLPLPLSLLLFSPYLSLLSLAFTFPCWVTSLHPPTLLPVVSSQKMQSGSDVSWYCVIFESRSEAVRPF